MFRRMGSGGAGLRQANSSARCGRRSGCSAWHWKSYSDDKKTILRVQQGRNPALAPIPYAVLRAHGDIARPGPAPAYPDAKSSKRLSHLLYLRSICSIKAGVEDVSVRGPKSCEIHGESPHAWACPECFAELRRERNHWKANHDNQVKINRLLRDRPDMGERAALVAHLMQENDELRARVTREIP